MASGIELSCSAPMQPNENKNNRFIYMSYTINTFLRRRCASTAITAILVQSGHLREAFGSDVWKVGRSSCTFCRSAYLSVVNRVLTWGQRVGDICLDRRRWGKCWFLAERWFQRWSHCSSRRMRRRRRKMICFGRKWYVFTTYSPCLFSLNNHNLTLLSLL